MKRMNKDKLIEELREEISELRTIISKLPGNVYWKNKEGRHLGCNNNLANFLNLASPNDIIGLTNAQVVPPNYIEMIEKNDLEVFTTKQEKFFEEITHDANGNAIIYLSQKKPLFDSSGEIKGLLGISIDITDRKRNEELLQIAKQKAETANRAKSRFLAMISHELRTPLTSILGFASLIEQPTLAAEKKEEYIRYIIDSGSYLLSLINNLLDYNKLETNKFELVSLPLNLKELIESVINMLGSTAKLKGLPITLHYDKNTPRRVIGNSRALSQILINLIGNAIKFTEQGHIAVSVNALKTTRESVVLQIAVEDTGIGIPTNKQQLIFKRFYQLGDAYARNVNISGTGLGLAIVKKLISLLDGKIEVKSAPDQGSTFYFTAKFTTVSGDDSPWLPYAAKVRILVTRDITKENDIDTLLANSTYDIVSSKETLNYLLTAQRDLRPYDILMIDNHLKDTNPNTLLQTIREHEDLYQPLPILLNSIPIIAVAEHWEVALDPSTMNVQVFQGELKVAWEKWQAKAKKYTPRLQSSREFHVLLVEDNLLIQIIHKTMLEELGCKVDVADTAMQALSMLDNNYDILFVDIGLQDMTGFDLIRRIRQQRHAIVHVPIIVLTGYSEEEERQHCLRVGANEVSVKPVSKDTLEKILDRYVRK